MATRPRFSGGRWLVVAAAALGLLAGCQAPASAPNDAAATGGPKVPRVVFAISSPVNETNDYNDAGLDNWQLRPAYEYLTGVDLEGRDVQHHVTQLATDWKLEPDGKSYRLQLRQGVPLHYGKGEFSAQDVRYSWQHILAPGSRNPHAQRYRDTVSDVEVVNNHEVVFRLTKVDLAFILALGEQEITYNIVSKEDGESRAQWPGIADRPVAGTGPYFIKEREEGKRVVYERVPWQHYRKTPEFPEFEFRFIRENSTRMAALLAGEVHMAALPFEMSQQAEQAGFKLAPGRAPIGPQAWLQLVGTWANRRVFPEEVLNPDPNAAYVFPNSPLLDLRVRKALSKAINRDELNRAYYKGKAGTIYNLFLHPTRPGWNVEWERRFQDEYGYDPEAAKRLLAEAGYGPANPLKHTILPSSSGAFYPELNDVVDSVANYWRAIGVQVAIDQSEPATVTAKNRTLAYDNHSRLVASSIRQLFGFGIYQTGTAGGRTGSELAPVRDFFESNLRQTLDESKWDGLWRQMGNVAYDQHANIPLFWLPALAVVNPTVVADYPFSGTLTGTYTNVEYIKPAG